MGLSPCPAAAAGAPASSSATPHGRCPTEYRPACLRGNLQCGADANGCTVCDCKEGPLRTFNRDDQTTP